MKKTFKFFAAALAIVAAASCAKELANDDANQTPEAELELVHKVFSASLNVDPETKTTLHTDGVSVHWTEDDMIKIIPSGKYQGNNFSVLSIDGTFADFEGETVDADSYRAVYPAGAYHNGFSYPNFCVFSDGAAALKTQYAVENNFSMSSFNTSSNFAVSATSKDNHLYFKNINAYFKLNLSMDNAASIEISSDKAEGSTGLSTSYDLGGTLNYKYYENKAYLSSNHSIIFTSKDGSNLKSGVTYYIAVPAVQVEGLKFAVKDASGAEITSFTKSSFTFEQNNIYNLGTIEKRKESLEVNAASFSFAAAGGSNSFNVVSNINWTVASGADWLSVSPSTGSATSGTVVTVTAAPNNTTSTRTATITVKAGAMSETITVTQAKFPTYQKYKVIKEAAQLQGGHLYAIALYSNVNYVWTNVNDYLVLTNNPYNNFTIDQVFEFKSTGTPNSGSAASYNSRTTGMLISAMTGKLVDANLNITITEATISDAQRFDFANRWGDEKGSDIDIYKTGTSTTLRGYYATGLFEWSNTGGENDTRKWQLYEVVEN